MKRPSSANDDDEVTDDGEEAGDSGGSGCATVSVSEGSIRFIETHTSEIDRRSEDARVCQGACHGGTLPFRRGE
jgi:hypothetical protein